MDMMGIVWDFEYVDFFNGEVCGFEFCKFNLMGECFVLVDGDFILIQLGVILDYLVEKLGLFSVDNVIDCCEIQCWILWDNYKMFGVVGMLCFLMNFLFEEKCFVEVIVFIVGCVKVVFKIFDGYLQGCDFVVINVFIIVDLSCVSYLYYFEFFIFDWVEYLNIDCWLDCIVEQFGWKYFYDLMCRVFLFNV